VIFRIDDRMWCVTVSTWSTSLESSQWQQDGVFQPSSVLWWKEIVFPYFPVNTCESAERYAPIVDKQKELFPACESWIRREDVPSDELSVSFIKWGKCSLYMNSLWTQGEIVTSVYWSDCELSVNSTNVREMFPICELSVNSTNVREMFPICEFSLNLISRNFHFSLWSGGNVPNCEFNYLWIFPKLGKCSRFVNSRSEFEHIHKEKIHLA
jgi:hypothetical protein